MSVKQPVSIAGIEFDALIESTDNYTSEIPEYPVEDGYMVSDNLVLKPLTLDLTVFVSNTPLTHLERFGGAQACKTRVDDVVSRLIQMRSKRELVTIVTNDKTYKNMGLESMSIKKSLEDGYSRSIPLSFKEVIITSTKSVTIPASYGKSGGTGASSGNAQTSSGSSSSGSSSSSDGSILFGMFGGK